MTLLGKRIAVTGVSSGIGKETAQRLVDAGASVVGLDRNEPADAIDKFVRVDLSDASSIDNAIVQVEGKLDGLCNVAGLPPTAGRVPVMKVNVIGLQRLTLGLIDTLNDGASIANVASLAGFGWQDSASAIRDWLAKADHDNVEALCDELDISDERCYFFSKEVLIAWTLINRWSWRDRSIRMNCVSPGPVETPILKDFIETMGARAEEDMRIMDRAGRPEDIAPLLVFLMSDESQWIRGANLPCDGGMSAHIQCQMNNLN